MADPQVTIPGFDLAVARRLPPFLAEVFQRFAYTGYQVSVTADSGSCGINFHYSVDSSFVDETGFVFSDQKQATLEAIDTGVIISLAELTDYRLHPVPFRVGFDGRSATTLLDADLEFDSYAEGWILENGLHGYLVMRMPSSSSMTCFVPAKTVELHGLRWMQIGSYGPDGNDHRTSNCFLGGNVGSCPLELPVTRFARFSGGWEEGVRLYRHILEEAMASRLNQYEPSPVTYNTFHDFGPSYTKEQIYTLLPQLSEMGFGMLHLDPGWETVWGSTKWDDEKFGPPTQLASEAKKYKISVGCWTSFHTTSPDVHKGAYTIGLEGKPYLAEEFGEVKLLGVCPESAWRETFIRNIGALAEAGFSFVNSDFHDWPWSGESCNSAKHNHTAPPTRTEWAESVDSAFCRLKSEYPHLKVEMHDHVESGEYRTPVWYLYMKENGYDEKWAYEFMWTTYDDLLSRKLFSLYHLRKAQPIPLYLHMNMTGDNTNALAFWYLASCVQHIGVGGLLKSPPEVRAAYAKAISLYNRNASTFGAGEFIGVDELTHVHVAPQRKSAVVLAFNITEDTIDRSVHFEVDGKAVDLQASIPPFDVLIKSVKL